MRNLVNNRNLKDSSRKWLQRHLKDPFVQQSKKDGYRSRSAYKLLDMHKKLKLFHNNMLIADLGAAPGGWLQIVRAQAPKCRLIACDLLPIAPLNGVTSIRGDFEEESIQQEIISHTQNKKFNLVLSDLAPNMIGVSSADQAAMVRLAESALKFAEKFGDCNSGFLIKLFSGVGVDDFVLQCRRVYKTIKHIKPKASRKESKEFYLYASNKYS